MKVFLCSLLILSLSPQAHAKPNGNKPLNNLRKNTQKRSSELSTPIPLPAIEPLTWANVPVSLQAPYCVVYDMYSGTVLLNQRMHDKMAPSSMTKIVTAFMVFNALKEGRIRLEDQALVTLEAQQKEGSRLFLKAGERATIDTLLIGMLVVSGNDAATTLAKSLSGDEQAFAQQMSEKSKELGATNSNFVNASGLPHEDHYSTCWDLMLWAKATLTNFPEYYKKYYHLRNFTYNNITQSNNLNPVLDSGGDGLKTGFTTQGQYGVVASQERHGRRVIVVVNGLESMAQRAQETEKLMNWAFNAYESIEIAPAAPIKAIPVYLAKKSWAFVSPQHPVRVSVPTAQKKDVTFKIISPSFLSAPLPINHKVGEIIVYLKDKEIARSPLVLTEAIVPSIWPLCMFKKLRLWFDRWIGWI